MRAFLFTVALLLAPTWASAQDLVIDNAMIPLAPPGTKAHAAYMTLTNTGETPRKLIGVSAEGYAMAHIHKTEVTNDIATMAQVDLLEIVSGQSIAFEHGGLHIMLMRPSDSPEEGQTVQLKLDFADGSSQSVDVPVVKWLHGG